MGRAHDAAMGTNGSGYEATPPMVMSALYGTRVKVISALRNPIDRLETSFWQHRHYRLHYGASADGLISYVVEQTEGFRHCEQKHGTRRCAYLFELLDKRYGDIFFHCDRLMVIRAEDLLDRPIEARGRLLRFLGLPEDSKSDPAGHSAQTSYGALHAASRKPHPPMLDSTRQLIDAFYRPHNERLAKLMGDPGLRWDDKRL